ncbi:MAG: DinB family protein [Caldilineaceae bacterium]|nr:DinB family protein [Caldilineaceae bacterium]
MDMIDRLLGHDVWTTQQLLQQCQTLTPEQWDQPFAIDHVSLRQTFVHMIEAMELWTDLLYERPVAASPAQAESPAHLQQRLAQVAREFAALARTIVREQREDDTFIDTLDNPPVAKTFGGAIAHVITHNMHHRAHVMYIMEQLGRRDHLEGDLLSWESSAFGWQAPPPVEQP